MMNFNNPWIKGQFGGQMSGLLGGGGQQGLLGSPGRFMPMQRPQMGGGMMGGMMPQRQPYQAQRFPMPQRPVAPPQAQAPAAQAPMGPLATALGNQQAQQMTAMYGPQPEGVSPEHWLRIMQQMQMGGA